MSLILSFAFTFSILYFLYLLYTKSDKLTLIYTNTLRNKKILNRTPSLTETIYIPTPFLLSGFLQNLYYTTMRSDFNTNPFYSVKRDLVKLNDGGQNSIDWICCPEVDKVFTLKTPIVVILPGLTGDRYCDYIRIIIEETCKRKFKCVVLNHRGCGLTALTTPKFYCGNSTDDSKAALAEIKRQHPNNPLYGIGTSLGATLLGNLAGKEGDKFLLKGMVLICGAYELHQSIKHMENKNFGISNMALGLCMKRKLKEHLLVFKKLEKNWGIDMDKEITKIKGVRDFDTLITSRLQGYKFPDNYYRTASMGQRLKGIKIPTLLFSSMDDPVIMSNTLPTEDPILNDNLILATHPCGGHLAFFSGFMPKQWYQYPVLDFIETVNSL